MAAPERTAQGEADHLAVALEHMADGAARELAQHVRSIRTVDRGVEPRDLRPVAFGEPADQASGRPLLVVQCVGRRDALALVDASDFPEAFALVEGQAGLGRVQQQGARAGRLEESAYQEPSGPFALQARRDDHHAHGSKIRAERPPHGTGHDCVGAVAGDDAAAELVDQAPVVEAVRPPHLHGQEVHRLKVALAHRAQGRPGLRARHGVLETGVRIKPDVRLGAWLGFLCRAAL
jgi:hypothetical protein